MATINLLVVGGGGAGGGSSVGGGGSGGQYISNTSFTVTPQAYTVTVGGGGSGGAVQGGAGTSSVFDTQTAVGGGGGGTNNGPANTGTGAYGGGSPGGGSAGSGGVGTVANNGGSGANTAAAYGGGGGGGSGGNGANGSGTNGGNGGAGTSNSITGTAVTYSGGGGAGVNNSGTPGTGANGGNGGSTNNQTAGTANTGNGGGGAGTSGNGGNGGTGIVVIAYKTDGSDGVSTSSTGGTITTSGSYTIHTFTTSGTWTMVASMAITFDAVTTTTSQGSISSKTFSHTCSGSDRILFVVAGCATSNDISSVTYNGVSMTQVGSDQTDSSSNRMTVWSLVNPASGTNNVVVTANSSGTIGWGAISFNGARQTSNPNSNTAGSETATTSYSITGTAPNVNQAAVMFGYAMSGSSLTAGTNTTIASQPEVTYNGTFIARTTSPQAGAGDLTLNVTSTSQTFKGIIVTFADTDTNALQDSLVSYYKLDESSGNAADSVGSNTLTNTNTVTYSTGKINNGANFGTANTNKKLTAATNLGITNGPISISCWVKLNTEIASGTWGFVQKGNATNHVQYIIAYEYNAGTRRIVFNRQKQNVANNLVTSNTTMGTSNYYHLVLTYDGTTLTGYANGSSVGTPLSTTGDGSGSGLNQIDIGEGGMFAATSYASINTDEVGIWNRALTSTEVTSLYNAGAGLQYPFNVSTYTATHDSRIYFM